MARVVVSLNFNAFLEKAKLKDDGSNYTDWVHNLRIILIAAQKNYVLEAPLGAKPVADATDNVKNVCQSKADDYSIVQCVSNKLYNCKMEENSSVSEHILRMSGV